MIERTVAVQQPAGLRHPCLVWQGEETSVGYARAGARVDLHRVISEWLGGPIREGQVVRHRCDRKLCLEPSHLGLGSPAENSADRVRRGHATTRAPMTEIEQAEVRRLRAAGARLKDIAVIVGRSYQAVQALIAGKTHGPPPRSIRLRIPLPPPPGGGDR